MIPAQLRQDQDSKGDRQRQGGSGAIHDPRGTIFSATVGPGGGGGGTKVSAADIPVGVISNYRMTCLLMTYTCMATVYREQCTTSEGS